MSLIKCPDCEQSISSNAKQCPHCGCAFQVCPECESILSGEHKTCPECGFQFVTKNEQTTVAPESKKRLLQWYDLSKISSPLIKVTTSSGFHFALRLVSFVLAAIAIITVYRWARPSNAEAAFLALAQYKDTLQASAALLILGALLWVITSLLEAFEDHISMWNFEKYSTANNLCLPDLIDEEFKIGFERGFEEDTLPKRVVAIERSILMLQYKKDIFAKIKIQRSDWIEWFGSFLFAVLFCIFAVINVENYMKFKLIHDTAFGFKQLDYIWLPIAAFVARLILSGIAAALGRTKSISEAWMKENLPQHMGDYTRYIAEYDKRLDEDLKEKLDKEINKD